jgi:hypothetical protein
VVTARDLAEAHSFGRRRLVRVFVAGGPVGPTRFGRAVLGGLVLAGLLVAGALVMPWIGTLVAGGSDRPDAPSPPCAASPHTRVR